MNTKTLPVHCSCSDDGEALQKILEESFERFLKKELAGEKL